MPRKRKSHRRRFLWRVVLFLAMLTASVVVARAAFSHLRAYQAQQLNRVR